MQRAYVINQRIHWIRYTLVFFCCMLRRKNYVLAVWLKMAETAFCNVIGYGLSALVCSHLTLTQRSTAVCDGFVRREGPLHVTTDQVWEKHLVSNFFVGFRPYAWSDTLWKEYWCSRYFSNGFFNH